MKNSVTIFSNGIADFRRVYSVKKDKPVKISIPVKREHIADILSTLTPLGPIHIKQPPSFTATNSAAGTLTLDPNNVCTDMVTKLSGAKVKVLSGGMEKVGRLGGLQKREKFIGDNMIEEFFLMIISEEGIQSVSFDSLMKLKFLEEDINSEIQKALDRNFQKIKPNSTFVNLEIETDREDTEAILQYTIPAAAWKMSYRLRNTGAVIEFQGLAIVDNNTDEDWKDFRLSVVTGEPITFGTDLAQIKLPQRETVNFVADKAQGAVITGQAFGMMRRSTPSVTAEYLKTVTPCSGSTDTEAYADSAFDAHTEIKEVGDFSIFESTDLVTIPAQQSAIIPMFSTSLMKAQIVLHFKSSNHHDRPFRAIDFKNETSHSLQRGPCAVVEKGVHQGSCDLPATKPQETQLLPYAVDTGVKVLAKDAKTETELVRVGFKNNEGVIQHKSTTNTIYRIANRKKEQYTFYLDHDKFPTNRRDTSNALSATLVSVDTEEDPRTLQGKVTKTGERYQFDLPAMAEVEVSVVETTLNTQKSILSPNFSWVTTIIRDTPLLENPDIIKCREISEQVSVMDDERSDFNEELRRLEGQQNRLRLLIGTGGHEPDMDAWKTELAENHRKLREIEDIKIPDLNKKIENYGKEIEDILKRLNLDWNK